MGTPAMWDSITLPPNAENSLELNKGQPNNPRANLVGSDTKKKNQMGLTPLKRALLSGGLLVTYKVHSLWAPR